MAEENQEELRPTSTEVQFNKIMKENFKPLQREGSLVWGPESGNKEPTWSLPSAQPLIDRTHWDASHSWCQNVILASMPRRKQIHQRLSFPSYALLQQNWITPDPAEKLIPDIFFMVTKQAKAQAMKGVGSGEPLAG